MAPNHTDFTYVDSATGGVQHRNHVVRVDELPPANGQAGCYTSYQRATAALFTWVKAHQNDAGNPSVAGFDGPTWSPFLPLDFDNQDDPSQALAWVRQTLERLEAWNVPLPAVRIYFSGNKGFHLELPHSLFGGFAPSVELPAQLKRAAGLLLRDIPFDAAIYDRLRLWRRENTKHEKTGLFKIPLTVQEVRDLGIPQIRELARRPRPGPAEVEEDEWFCADELAGIWKDAQTEPAGQERGHVDHAPTDAERDSYTVANIASAWPIGGHGASRHTDLLLPLAGYFTRRTTADHAIDLLKGAAVAAGDGSFLHGRSWESEIARLVHDARRRHEAGRHVAGLPTIAERFPPLAKILAVLWADPELRPSADDPAMLFPLDCLPDPFHRLADMAASSMVAAPDFVAIPLLTAAGVAIGNVVEIEPKIGWREGSQLYTASVGLPGSKKSPMDAVAVGPLHAIQRRLTKAFEAAQEAYETAQRLWEALPKKERGAPPRPPTYRHVFTTDATLEALAPMLRDGKGVLLDKEELSGWAGDMDKYRGGKGSDRQSYLSLWSRRPIKVDRKGGPPILVTRPCLGVTGGIQPDLLGSLADSAQREDGFVPRVLFGYPDPVPDYLSDDLIPWEIGATVNTVFERLYAIEDGTDLAGEPTPIVLTLSESGLSHWKSWYAEHAAETQAESLPAPLQLPWSKLPGQLLRVALILHVSGYACGPGTVLSTEVTGETIDAAADIIAYFKSHARRVYRLMLRHRQPLPIRILILLRQHGPMTLRQLNQALRGNVRAEVYRAALDELAAGGLATRERREPDPIGGRPATVWRAT